MGLMWSCYSKDKNKHESRKDVVMLRIECQSVRLTSKKKNLGIKIKDPAFDFRDKLEIAKMIQLGYSLSRRLRFFCFSLYTKSCIDKIGKSFSLLQEKRCFHFSYAMLIMNLKRSRVSRVKEFKTFQRTQKWSFLNNYLGIRKMVLFFSFARKEDREMLFSQQKINDRRQMVFWSLMKNILVRIYSECFWNDGKLSNLLCYGIIYDDMNEDVFYIQTNILS